MAGGRTAVPAVELTHYVHSLGHFPERCETAGIKAGVVSKVDEHLSGSRVGSGHRTGDGCRATALPHRVVLDVGIGPGFVDSRTSGQAELNDETGHHAEKCRA